MFTEREKIWLALTRRLAIACAVVFVALVAMAGYVVLGRADLSDFFVEHELVGGFLLVVMQVVGLMAPALALVYGFLILRAHLRR